MTMAGELKVNLKSNMFVPDTKRYNTTELVWPLLEKTFALLHQIPDRAQATTLTLDTRPRLTDLLTMQLSP